MSRIFLANNYSDFVHMQAPIEYINKMHAGGARKIWYLQEGDVLITAFPIDKSFLSYIEKETDITLNKVKLLHPKTEIKQGIQEEEASQLLRDFFLRLRKQKGL